MNDEELQSIEREIRAWTARAPSRSPQVARTRVLARLDKPRAWFAWRWAVAATALAGLAVGFLVVAPDPAFDPPPTAVAERPAERPGQGLLVYELRSGTKLYLALAAREPAGPTLTH